MKFFYLRGRIAPQFFRRYIMATLGAGMFLKLRALSLCSGKKR